MPFPHAPNKLIALNVAAHRLENLIQDRRLVVASAQGTPQEPVQG